MSAENPLPRDETRQTPEPARKLFFGLFIFPLVIAVGMALLLCAIVFMTSEKETPDTLIASIKSGAKGKRWQKAFELSNELNLHPQAATPEMLKEILHIFDPWHEYDPQTRSYMAAALTRFRDPRAVSALEGALADENQDVRLYSLWALGRMPSVSSASRVLLLLEDPAPEMRKTAAYVLGVLGDAHSKPALREKLSDGTPDVRWNAALALARLGDPSGSAILRTMLDRSALESELKLDEAPIEAAMINAVKGLVLIHDVGSVTILESVSRNDRNLKVRQAAIEALREIKKG